MAENKLQQSMGDSYKCPICLETCQELKTLNCQHSFCLSCLQNCTTEKGTLNCPNCRQTHPIPEGELQELSLNNIEVETAEHLDKDHDNISCCCGKCNADFYCEDCSQHLCTTCKNYHDRFPALKNHKLQSINTNWPRSLVGPEPLHQPMCPLHEKVLEFYCNICKTPICQKCAVTDHREDKGQHEPIRASDAFKDFKTTATHLLFVAYNYERKIKLIIDKCLANASNLEHSRRSLKKEINDALQEIVNLVKDTGIIIDRKLDDVYKTKKETTDSQVEELNNILSDVKAKEDIITKLLECDEATALLTCQQAITELQEKIDVLPDAEPRDDGKVYFSPTKDHILGTLKKHGIGSVSEKNENMFEIVSDSITVTCYQPFHFKIAQRFKCEIDINDLKVSEFEETNSSMGIQICQVTSRPTYKVVKKSNGDYFVEGSSQRALKLDVKYCNSSIKGSPIAINVESKYLVISIENVGQSTGILSNKRIKDLLMFENGWFLVACDTNEIFKFDNSGAFISKITLPSTSEVHRICKLKNNHLIFFDPGNRNITICKQDGHVIKSISIADIDKDQPAKEEVGPSYKLAPATCISRPVPTSGFGFGTARPVHFQVEWSSDIDVNEALNLVYVADHTANCVQVFDMESNLKVKTIGSKGGLEGQMNEPSGVAVTKEGNLIVADTQNHRLQLFGTNGQFIKVLIGGGSDDGMVIKPTRVDVDNDDNIIVVSESKVQLFNNNGKFIRMIQQSKKGGTINRTKKEECKFFAISIVSHFPRRLALAEEFSNTVKVINY